MKLKVLKKADTDNDSEDPKLEPKGGDSDDPQVAKKVKLKGKKQLPTQYGTYSGIVDEKGAKDNPTETESIVNMAHYMRNNQMPASDQPSNVYRQKFSHLGVVYDRKKALKDT